MSITKAIADYSIAVGYNSSSRGKYGISLGTQSEQFDESSISIGHNSDAGLTLGNSTWTEQTSDKNGGYLTIVCNTPSIGAYSGSPLWISISYASATTANANVPGKIITSVDGETWTIHSTAGDGMDWRGFTSAVPTVGDLSNNMLFVAVGRSGSAQRAMTSQDGVNWTLQTTNNNNWESITHGVPSVGDLSNNMLFVAVASNGTNNRVMTSQDCITWTTQDTTNMDYDWRHITSGIPSTGNHSGKTLFAAVSFDSYLMTSEDAINWTLQPDPTGNGLEFRSICTGTPNTGIYANQILFVSVGNANSSGVVMVSNDGYTWNQHTTPGDSNNWIHVSSHTKNGITIFIACANTGSSNRIMTSYDGYTWNTETTGDYDYRCIASGIPSSGTYSGETLIVVSQHTGSTTGRITTSNFSCKNSIAIGTNATTGAENCVAIGYGANAPNSNTIILGDGTQNVGIGTNDPIHRLSLMDSTGGMFFEVDSGSYNRIKSHTESTSTGKDLSITARSSGDTQMYFDSNNTIGVNMAPTGTYRFEVNGTIRGASEIYAQNWFRAQASGGYYFQSHGGGWHMSDSTYLRNYNNKILYGHNHRTSHDGASARVGIGNNSSSYALYVTASGTNWEPGSFSRSIGYNHDHWGDYNKAMFDHTKIMCNGGIVGSAVLGYSDRRIKKNIVEINDSLSLEKIRNLKPCRYQYKDVLTKGHAVVDGFIAQEVQEFMPEAIKEEKKNLPNIYSWGEFEYCTDLSYAIITLDDPSLNLITDLEYDSSNNLFKEINLWDGSNNHFEVQITEIITEIQLKVFIPEFVHGNKIAAGDIFVEGQEVNNCLTIRKDAIWTAATAALQEIDRNQQEEKTKTANLETEVNTLKTQMADLLARITALENP